MKSVDHEKQNLMAGLLMGGVGALIAGIFLVFLALVVRSQVLFALGPTLMGIGVLVLVGSLVVGYKQIGSNAARTPREPVEGRIVAKFAINELGEMLFDNFDYDAQEARFYVKVVYLDGRREEFETARAVFDHCGEGMRGVLTVQGNWLSQFQPLPDTEETKAAYRYL